MSRNKDVKELRRNRKPVSPWPLPILFLCILWVYLIFSSPGPGATQSIVPLVAVSALALLFLLRNAYPRRPRQLGSAVLGLCFLYALWTVVSAAAVAGGVEALGGGAGLGGAGLGGAGAAPWAEAQRALLYLMLLGLTLMYLTEWSARAALRYLLLSVGVLVAGLATLRLGAAGDLTPFFSETLLAYPLDPPQVNAGLLLTLFWPLLWLAADSNEVTALRGIALGTCATLAGMAVMTGAAGAFAAFTATAVLAVLIFPRRLRLLVFLVVPSALLVWSSPGLAGISLPQGTAGDESVFHYLIISFLVAALVGVVLSSLEDWVHISDRMRLVFGLVVGGLVVVGLVYAGGLVEALEGDAHDWLSQQWEEPAVVQQAGTAGTAGSNRSVLNLLRSGSFGGVREAGAMLLGLAALLLGVGGVLWPRFRAGLYLIMPGGEGRRQDRWRVDSGLFAWETALTLGLLYWAFHAAISPLWQIPAATMPALFCLALGISFIDARAEILWPRLHTLLRRGGGAAEPRPQWFRALGLLVVALSLVVAVLAWVST